MTNAEDTHLLTETRDLLKSQVEAMETSRAAYRDAREESRAANLDDKWRHEQWEQLQRSQNRWQVGFVIALLALFASQWFLGLH